MLAQLLAIYNTHLHKCNGLHAIFTKHSNNDKHTTGNRDQEKTMMDLEMTDLNYAASVNHSMQTVHRLDLNYVASVNHSMQTVHKLFDSGQDRWLVLLGHKEGVNVVQW